MTKVTFTLIRKVENPPESGKYRYYRYEQKNTRIGDMVASKTTYKGKATKEDYDLYQEKRYMRAFLKTEKSITSKTVKLDKREKKRKCQ